MLRWYQRDAERLGDVTIDAIKVVAFTGFGKTAEQMGPLEHILFLPMATHKSIHLFDILSLWVTLVQRSGFSSE